MKVIPVLEFLTQLQQNNNKAWMDEHKKAYQEVRSVLISFSKQLLDALQTIDPSLASLEVKDCVFRINRDIRFSKDKTPYKTNMGAYFSQGGKNGLYAGYYLHLQPHNYSFVGGGIYHPQAEQLKLIRQEVDYNGAVLEKIVNKPVFRNFFGELKGEKLQNPPKGYALDHPYINWLKLKSFIALRSLSDEQVGTTNLMAYLLEAFEALLPFNQFLNTALEEL